MSKIFDGSKTLGIEELLGPLIEIGKGIFNVRSQEDVEKLIESSTFKNVVRMKFSKIMCCSFPPHETMAKPKDLCDEYDPSIIAKLNNTHVDDRPHEALQVLLTAAFHYGIVQGHAMAAQDPLTQFAMKYSKREK